MSPAAADGHVVVDGLVSPLGFAIGSDGTFYVAEAFAGQLTSIDKKGKRRTLVSGSDGQFTSGVDAKGRGTLTYTLSLPPEFAEQESGVPARDIRRIAHEFATTNIKKEKHPIHGCKSMN